GVRSRGALASLLPGGAVGSAHGPWSALRPAERGSVPLSLAIEPASPCLTAPNQHLLRRSRRAASIGCKGEHIALALSTCGVLQSFGGQSLIHIYKCLNLLSP